jgi:hypothetical protein
LKIPGIQEVKGWTPYRNTHPGDLKDQLVGWTVEYNMLSFYVIRAAGHVIIYLILRWSHKIKEKIVFSWSMDLLMVDIYSQIAIIINNNWFF